MAQMALPGYEAMHTIAKSLLRSHLPERASLLIVGAGAHGVSEVWFGQFPVADARRRSIE
jgi:tRNA (cmo5U34)-methyltransferase